MSHYESGSPAGNPPAASLDQQSGTAAESPVEFLNLSANAAASLDRSKDLCFKWSSDTESEEEGSVDASSSEKHGTAGQGTALGESDDAIVFVGGSCLNVTDAVNPSQSVKEILQRMDTSMEQDMQGPRRTVTENGTRLHPPYHQHFPPVDIDPNYIGHNQPNMLRELYKCKLPILVPPHQPPPPLSHQCFHQ